MTEKNIEKLAAEGERLLMKELESRYRNLRKVTGEFLEAKGKGLQNTPIKPGTYIAYGPFVLSNSRTSRDNYIEALENFVLWANRVNEFGLSISPWGIDVKSYEEVLK